MIPYYVHFNLDFPLPDPENFVPSFLQMAEYSINVQLTLPEGYNPPQLAVSETYHFAIMCIFCLCAVNTKGLSISCYLLNC